LKTSANQRERSPNKRSGRTLVQPWSGMQAGKTGFAQHWMPSGMHRKATALTYR
jgi:hypothetical protein